MELLTIRESSLGGYTQAIQDAILAGYRMSMEPSKYPSIDQQYNAVLERSDTTAEPSAEEHPTAEPTKKLAGRPPRKL